MWKVNEVEMNSEFIFVKKNVQLFTSLLSVGEKRNYCNQAMNIWNVDKLMLTIYKDEQLGNHSEILKKLINDGARSKTIDWNRNTTDLQLDLETQTANKNNLQAFPCSIKLKLKFRWICQNKMSTMTFTYLDLSWWQDCDNIRKKNTKCLGLSWWQDLT